MISDVAVIKTNDENREQTHEPKKTELKGIACEFEDVSHDRYSPTLHHKDGYAIGEPEQTKVAKPQCIECGGSLCGQTCSQQTTANHQVAGTSFSVTGKKDSLMRDQENTVDGAMLGGVLSREQLRQMIDNHDRPLLREYLDLESQIQPNGVDLTLREISQHAGGGAIGISSDDRVLPELEVMAFDDAGWLTLEPGCYHILYNEIVDIPDTLMALGRPRSSLNRCGVTIHTAVWDAGYTGRSTSMLVVNNPDGFRVQRDSRVMQLVFIGMSEATVEGYRGRYHLENL